jgi:hypothetical protein
VVRDQRLISLFVGPIAHYTVAGFGYPFCNLNRFKERLVLERIKFSSAGHNDAERLERMLNFDRMAVRREHQAIDDKPLGSRLSASRREADESALTRKGWRSALAHNPQIFHLIGQRDLGLRGIDRVRRVGQELGRQGGEKRREDEAAAGAGDVVELRACGRDLQAFQYARAPSQADSVTHGRAQRRASRSFAARPSCPVRAATRLISSSASPGSTSTFTTCLRNFRRLRKSRIRSAGVLALRMGSVELGV